MWSLLNTEHLSDTHTYGNICSKNGDQNNMCYDEIGLSVQNLDTNI